MRGRDRAREAAVIGLIYVAVGGAKAQKRQIVAESYEPGVSASIVARRYSVNAKQVIKWRRLYRELTRDVRPSRFVPVVVDATPDGEVDG